MGILSSNVRLFVVWPTAGAFAGFMLHKTASDMGSTVFSSTPWFLWSTLLAAAGATLAALTARRVRSQRDDRVRFAAEQRWQVIDEPSRDVRIRFRCWFSTAQSHIENVIATEADGTFFGIADVPPTREGQRGRTVVVAESNSIALPQICVAPRTRLGSFLQRLLVAPPVEFADDPEFGRHFVVTSEEPDRARAVLTRRVIELLVQPPHVEMRGRGSRLAILLPLNASSDLLRSALDLIRGLLGRFQETEEARPSSSERAPVRGDAAAIG